MKNGGHANKLLRKHAHHDLPCVTDHNLSIRVYFRLSDYPCLLTAALQIHYTKTQPKANLYLAKPLVLSPLQPPERHAVRRLRRVRGQGHLVLLCPRRPHRPRHALPPPVGPTRGLVPPGLGWCHGHVCRVGAQVSGETHNRACRCSRKQPQCASFRTVSFR